MSNTQAKCIYSNSPCSEHSWPSIETNDKRHPSSSGHFFVYVDTRKNCPRQTVGMSESNLNSEVRLCSEIIKESLDSKIIQVKDTSKQKEHNIIHYQGTL